jgi:hypothetical protein
MMIGGIDRRAMKAVLFVLIILSAPSVACADEPGGRLCGTWGIDAWGLSYHVDHAIHYNDANWGLGVRCYARPEWRIFGKSSDNKALLQIDALLNSHRGLLIPVSIGAEYKLTTLPGGCKLFFVGAFTVAYYQTPGKASDVKWGPVPGVAAGCGRFKPNVIFVPSTSGQIVAAIAASMTIVFK